MPTVTPDNERGVAVECESEAERDALLAELESHFGAQRFLNTAAAFDAVKDYVVMRAMVRSAEEDRGSKQGGRKS